MRHRACVYSRSSCFDIFYWSILCHVTSIFFLKINTLQLTFRFKQLNCNYKNIIYHNPFNIPYFNSQSQCSQSISVQLSPPTILFIREEQSPHQVSTPNIEIARERITALLNLFVNRLPFMNLCTSYFLNIDSYIWTRQTEQLIYSFDQFEKSDSTYLLPFSFSKK